MTRGGGAGKEGNYMLHHGYVPQNHVARGGIPPAAEGRLNPQPPDPWHEREPPAAAIFIMPALTCGTTIVEKQQVEERRSLAGGRKEDVGEGLSADQ